MGATVAVRPAAKEERVRSAGVQVSGRLSYRDAIKAYVERHPKATDDEVRRATGAPSAVAKRLVPMMRRGLNAAAEPGTR